MLTEINWGFVLDPGGNERNGEEQKFGQDFQREPGTERFHKMIRGSGHGHVCPEWDSGWVLGSRHVYWREENRKKGNSM